jgi:pimeloyl-ACP methyl ester carboxylesterase
LEVRGGAESAHALSTGDVILTTATSSTPTHDVIPLAGGRIAYSTVGSGEPVLLVHGLGGTGRTWRHLVATLAETHLVIAPDLPGHGGSDAPAGDYSLGAHAAALRDLLVALGLSTATLVGHSLGGGVAMQFAYQFPERTDRLALVSSGGLGAGLTPMLRAATVPGAEPIVAALAHVPRAVTRRVLLPAMSRVPGLVSGQDSRSLADDLRGLADGRARHAFVRTARSVIDWRGQTVSAARQLGLLADLPVLVVWGDDDRTIPPHHHRSVVRELPHARLVEISGAGHYPQETAPDDLLPPLRSFLAETAPFHYTETRWRQLLRTPQVTAA